MRLPAHRPPSRSFACFALALWLLPVLAGAQESGAAESHIVTSSSSPVEAVIDDPEDLAQLAVEQNPGLDALTSRTQALRETAAAARLWTDPRFAVELSNLPVDRPLLDSHPMAGLQFKLQQQFPAPGETAARAATANQRVKAAKADVGSAERALRGEVRGRYWDLALVRQLRVLSREHVEELTAMLGSLDARYEVGVTSQHDLLQLQLRRDRVAEDLADFDAQETALLAVLNGALSRPPATPVTTPMRSTPLTGFQVQVPGAEALATHPAILALKARAATARAEASQARIEARPEPTAWLGYRVRSEVPGRDLGTNFVTAGISVPIPLASVRRYRAASLSAEARARQAEEAADALLDRLEASLAASAAEFDRAERRAKAFRDELEPTARAALESTSAAYEVDRAAFADLIRAEIALLDVQRRLRQAETQAASSLATIRTLTDPPAEASKEAP